MENYLRLLFFLFVFFSIHRQGEGRAFSNADPQTNLFSPDGPLAQLGNEIAAGASQLQNELDNGAKLLKADLNNAANFLSQGSLEEIAGVNIGGLHAGLKTNIFSKTGPLAQIQNDLTAGAKALESNIQKEANALGQSLAGAANALQENFQESADFLTKGLQNLGNQITASGGASLDNLLKIGGNNEESSLAKTGKSLGTPPQISLDSLAKVFDSGNGVEKDTISFFGDNSGTSGLNIFGQISGQPQTPQKTTKIVTVTSGNPTGGGGSQGSSSGTITIETNLQGGANGRTTTGQNFALTPEILAEVMKRINLPDMCKAV